jgi:hypothetical protein
MSAWGYEDGVVLGTWAERQLASQLFNAVWDLLDAEGRSVEEDERMLHMVHAARHHWGQVGGPEHRVRGEWQCSRVYAVLGRPEPALHHARRCLQLCEDFDITDWDIAFAYEAMARAHAVAGDAEQARTMTALALAAVSAVVHEEDREPVLAELATIPGQVRYW